MSDLLRIENLHVTFATDAGPAPAVKGVSLSVTPGRCWPWSARAAAARPSPPDRS